MSTATRKPTALMLAALAQIASECDANREGAFCYYPATRSVLGLESRGLIKTWPNRHGGPDPRVTITGRGRDALAVVRGAAQAAAAEQRIADDQAVVERLARRKPELPIALTDDDRVAMAEETAPGVFAGPTESAPCNAHSGEKYYYRAVWSAADGGPEILGAVEIVSYCAACLREHGAPPPVVARAVRTPSALYAVVPRHAGRVGDRVMLVSPKNGISPRVVILMRCVDTRTDESAWAWTSAA